MIIFKFNSYPFNKFQKLYNYRIRNLILSMNISRPFSAPKSRTKKQESKLVISGFKRPNSAKAHSLKQIIQVI